MMKITDKTKINEYKDIKDINSILDKYISNHLKNDDFNYETLGEDAFLLNPPEPYRVFFDIKESSPETSRIYCTTMDDWNEIYSSEEYLITPSISLGVVSLGRPYSIEDTSIYDDIVDSFEDALSSENYNSEFTYQIFGRNQHGRDHITNDKYSSLDINFSKLKLRFRVIFLEREGLVVIKSSDNQKASNIGEIDASREMISDLNKVLIMCISGIFVNNDI